MPVIPKLVKAKKHQNPTFEGVKDRQIPIVQMSFPLLGAFMNRAKFLYQNLKWKEICSMMAI